MERSFQYRGDLAATALPEILHTIDRFQVPGVVEASFDGVVKRIWVKEGAVVHASSTDRADSLGTFLQQGGKLTPEQYDDLMRERQRSDKRLGVLLIERRLLAPAEVYRAIRKQIEGIVWSLFYWQAGEITFSLGGFVEPDRVRIELPMRQVILQGIKRAPDAKPLVARLGRRETVFEPCFRSEDLIELALDRDDYRLLELIDGQRTLYDICTQGPHAAADNGKLLYAFQVLQLVRRAESREAAEPAPREEQPAAAVPTGSGAIKIRFKTPGSRYGT